MAQQAISSVKWSLIKKLLFCFFFIFFTLYILLNPNAVIPYFHYVHILYLKPCNTIIEWLAKDVFRIVRPDINFYNGTIDTLFGYLVVLFIFLTAIIGTLVWQVVGRRAVNYEKLYNILVSILRYYLAISWIAYGAMKIVQLQFPPLSPLTLLQTYGNSSPKEIAWAFMGYSPQYNFFVGLTECAAGLLLFFRRTSTLGNLVGLGILINVVAFNYNYYVNVKLLTTMLLAMTLFLMLKDISRLISFFFLNKAITPVTEPAPYFQKKWKNMALSSAKYLFIFYLFFFDIHGDLARARQVSPQRTPLYGIYNVTLFTRNKDTLKPLTTDTLRWNKLIVSPPAGNASVMLMNGGFKDFVFKPDTVKKRMELYAKNDTVNKYTFNYSLTRDSVLSLNGKWRGDSITIKLKQVDMNKFPLMNKGFHWIIDRNFKRYDYPQ